VTDMYCPSCPKQTVLVTAHSRIGILIQRQKFIAVYIPLLLATLSEMLTLFLFPFKILEGIILVSYLNIN